METEIMKTKILSLFFRGHFVGAIVRLSQKGRSIRSSASGQGNESFQIFLLCLPEILTDLFVSALGVPLIVSNMHVSTYIFVYFSIWALP